eukprot:gene12894-17278_t
MDGSYQSLRDFDWSMRLILSSDKLSSLQKPILQLKLDIESADKSITNQILEMDINEINSLLEGLKSAQKALQKK